MANVDARVMANAIRFLSMDAIKHAGEGHPGTPLGAADITTALFTRHPGSTPGTRYGSTATALSCRMAMARCCSTHCCISPGRRRSRSTKFAAFASLARHARDIRISYRARHRGDNRAAGAGRANAAGMALAEAFLNRWLYADLADHHVCTGGRRLSAGRRRPGGDLACRGRLAWLLEIPIIPMACTRSSTERVDTPWT